MAESTLQKKETKRQTQSKKQKQRTVIRVPADILDESGVSKKSNLYKLSRTLLTHFNEFTLKSGKKLSQLHTRFSIDQFDVETTVELRPAGHEAEIKFRFSQRVLPLKQFSVFLQQTENGYDVCIDFINIKIEPLNSAVKKFQPQEIGNAVVEIAKGINEILREIGNKRISLTFEENQMLDYLMSFKGGTYCRKLFELIGLMSVVHTPGESDIPEGSIITLGRDDRAKLTFIFPERTVSAQSVLTRLLILRKKN